MSNWRVIGTDSENETGVAPICINTANLGGPHPNHADPWVYDCCPRPQIECGTPSAAKVIATALTTADAEVI